MGNNDAMREKVARAIGDADHGLKGRAALEACHFEELVKAVRRMWNAIDQEYDVDDGIPNFSGDVTLAWEELGQILAKVKDEGHG